MPGLLDPRAPMVGTRSPLPSGGGGGMSQDAILRAIIARKLMEQQQGGNLGLGSLPANPLMNPGAIVDARMRGAGA